MTLGSRAMALAMLVATIIACNAQTNPNGPPVVATQDISGQWAGHGDAGDIGDSMVVTLSQAGTGAVSGGGVFWQNAQGQSVAVIGTRKGDSLYLSLPDSVNPPPDTTQFAGVVTKDSFGDELFGVLGFGSTTGGFTFTLHRR